MTTIAASLECMAGDSYCQNGSYGYPVDKIFRVGDVLLGVAGDADACAKFIAWRGNQKTKPEFGADADFTILELNAQGLFIYNSCIYPDQIKAPFYAIGSGGLAAMVAMRLGCTPEQAVVEVCAIEMNSCEPVTVLALKPKKMRNAAKL